MPSRRPARSAASPSSTGEWAWSRSARHSRASASTRAASAPISRHSRIGDGAGAIGAVRWKVSPSTTSHAGPGSGWRTAVTPATSHPFAACAFMIARVRKV